MFIRSFLLAVAILVAASITVADKRSVIGEPALLTPPEYLDPLVWENMVIRCTILRFETEIIPAADWFTPAILEHDSGRPVDISKMIVRVHEMLRGCVEDSVLVLKNLDNAEGQEAALQWRASVTGKEVVVAVSYRDFPHPTWSAGWVYVRSDQDWARPDEILTDEEVRERVSRVSVPRIARECDLALKGTVLSRRDVGVPGNSFPEYVIRPVEVLKGEVAGNITLQVKRYAGLNDGSKWRTFIPFELDTGASWYLFVNRNEGVFEPAAAWRSAFLVDGDRLVERRDPSCYTPTSLEKEIREAVGP